ncbi:hypothetical protein CM240_0119 [Clostridium bornimense]|uniref:Uncharacterized protein n=1 Tax=Clostridium bornimense TaxID=1216932 RepID=W6RSS7_9CLOT|nr:hypothetical protein [Clostridium bornimense]CDM67298.1 hypothetical protein CM240_0119 [Clostridium bornimense]
MEYLGLIAFILIMSYSSYPAKIKKIESKIKKLERNLRGEKSMSKILSELINKKCILVSDIGLTLVSKKEIECTILDADDEWIKFTYTDKKGVSKTEILRVEAIERVSFIEN